jgi:hypothetical protein
MNLQSLKTDLKGQYDILVEEKKISNQEFIDLVYGEDVEPD